MNSKTEAVLSIPVIYTGASSQILKQSKLPSFIKVYVKANGFDFLGQKLSGDIEPLNINFSDLIIKYSDSSITSKTIPADFFLKDFIANLPGEFTYSHAQPDSITFQFLKKYSKKIPVKLNLKLSLKKQFIRDGKTIIKPDSVEISGPQNKIQNVAYIETMPVSFSSVDSDVFFSTALKNPDTSDISLSHTKAWVLVPVNEFTEEVISLPVEKIKFENKTLKLFPSKVNVTYHVSLRNSRLIRKENFKIEVPDVMKAIQEKKEKLTINLSQFPKQVKIVSIQPEQLNYYLTEE